jgi:hypothetical protein
LRQDPVIEQHFAAIGESLRQSIADLSDRLDAERKAPGGIGMVYPNTGACQRRKPVRNPAAKALADRPHAQDLVTARS